MYFKVQDERFKYIWQGGEQQYPQQVQEEQQSDESGTIVLANKKFSPNATTLRSDTRLPSKAPSVLQMLWWRLWEPPAWLVIRRSSNCFWRRRELTEYKPCTFNKFSFQVRTAKVKNKCKRENKVRGHNNLMWTPFNIRPITPNWHKLKGKNLNLSIAHLLLFPSLYTIISNSPPLQNMIQLKWHYVIPPVSQLSTNSQSIRCSSRAIYILFKAISLLFKATCLLIWSLLKHLLPACPEHIGTPAACSSRACQTANPEPDNSEPPTCLSEAYLDGCFLFV